MKTKLNLSRVLLLSTMFLFVFAACNKDVSLEPDLRSGEVELKNGHASQNHLLAQIRSATAKYQNAEVAFADGFVLDPHCVEVPGVGGMGFHAINFSRVDGVVNPLEPEVLVYEAMQNGKLRLVAVEYIVVAAPWDAENDGPPMIGNVAFADHRPPGSTGPGFPHYQLHVWVWKHNPLGMYFPLNPKVSCEYSFYFEAED
jgi:hypothetical protein